MRLLLLNLLFCCWIPMGGWAADYVALGSDIASGWGGGNNWLKSQKDGFKPYGYQIVSGLDGHPVRRGEQAIRFEVRWGDCGSAFGWDDCATDRERHELSQEGNQQREGDTYWYAWSMFIPAETPSVVPTKTTFGQFHQRKNNVIWMFLWSYRGLQIDNQIPGRGRSLERKLLVPIEELRGKWVDIIVHAKWSSGMDGVFDIYVNHQQRYRWRGQTIADGDTTYFKFGLYRSFISRYKAANDVQELPTQTVYYDEVNRGRTLAKVDRVGVARLQTRLKNEGLYSGKIDGLWGPQTLLATNRLVTALGQDEVADYSIDLWAKIGH